MSNCKKCGTGLDRYAQFCSNCGAPSETIPPCVYHPEEEPIGRCAEKRCRAGFCSACEVVITNHGSDCLDCGARFARRKLRTGYIIGGTGIACGLVGWFAPGPGEPFLLALIMPVLMGYIFWSTYYGWHYGGKFWARLFDSIERFFGGSEIAEWVLPWFFLWLRLLAAFWIGILGGGIIQNRNYRNC